MLVGHGDCGGQAHNAISARHCRLFISPRRGQEQVQRRQPAANTWKPLLPLRALPTREGLTSAFGSPSQSGSLPHQLVTAQPLHALCCGKSIWKPTLPSVDYPMLGKPSAGEICCLSRAARRSWSVGENMDLRILPKSCSKLLHTAPSLHLFHPKYLNGSPVVMSAVDIRAAPQQHSCCCPQLSHDSPTKGILTIVILLFSLLHSSS